MEELIKEIEKKIITKEDLIFFLQEIDFANQLVSKHFFKKNLKIFKNKIDPFLFSVLETLMKKDELSEEKKSLLEEKEKRKKRLEIVLKKEKELEEKIREIEEKEKKATGEKEKEIEKKRWELEKERIETEKEKWDLKESCQKIEEELKKIGSQKEEKNFEKLNSFLKLLRERLISLPEIHFEVAFELPKDTILKISNWFEEKIGKKFIFDFRINPKIVGGAVIEYKGKILDFSLRKEIGKEILRQHQKT